MGVAGREMEPEDGIQGQDSTDIWLVPSCLQHYSNTPEAHMKYAKVGKRWQNVRYQQYYSSIVVTIPETILRS